MTAVTTDSTNQLIIEPSLAVSVRAEAKGAPLAREAVTPADLAEHMSEIWRDACLRQGHPSLPLAELPIRLVPLVTGQSGSQCQGFQLEVALPDGQRRAIEFSLYSLERVAWRAAQPLIAKGLLSGERQYFYALELDSEHPTGTVTAPDGFKVAVRTLPLTFLEVPIKSLLDRATPVGQVDANVLPVFYTKSAYRQAEECSREGAKAHPPVETGGVLVGSLATCPESGEFYVIVTQALEVQHAEQTTFSLSYTGQSWHRIQSIIRARQTAHPERAERLLGQCHGHNFLPGDGHVCEECPKRPQCTLTSAFVSPEDRTWMRAVFLHQPWALCHIFGLTARQEPVQSLFSGIDGRLQPRGFYLIEQLDPEPWKPFNKTKKRSEGLDR